MDPDFEVVLVVVERSSTPGWIGLKGVMGWSRDIVAIDEEALGEVALGTVDAPH